MKNIATLISVAALGLGGSITVSTSASAVEPGLEWRPVTADTNVQLDRLCWQTQHVWDAAAALTDIPCTPVAQFPDGTWVSFYVANTGGPAPTDLEWREVSSYSIPMDRLCWQTQHVWDPQALTDLSCTPTAQTPDGKQVAYYLAHKAA